MNKIKKLNNIFLETLLMDLDDPQKCTPGLYQVIRGVINDNKEMLDDIPKDSLDFLENKMKDSLPFKKEVS
jgi:hypothetical protein|tara:strand:- start:1889 stop:2101 length:213 start_codon:yes stop_codon:yes gene_type:complete